MREQVYNVKYNDGDFIVAGVYRRTEDGFIIKALGHNKFSERKEEIPEGAEFSELSERQCRYFCRDAVPVPDLDGLELGKWIEDTKPFHLRINDVMDFKEGQEIMFLVMDRNLYDIACEDDGNILFQPKHFFGLNTATYTHSRDLKGTIVYHWAQENSPEYPFEFEIEYAPGNWYPLTDGHLPARDPQEMAPFDYDEPKPYTDFPVDTRLGWRGPMMKWDDLDIQPDVFWHDDTPQD